MTTHTTGAIGADPELFITHYEKGSMPIFGLVGGSKKDPRKMRDLEAGFAYLEDNAALEFNIPPQATPRAFGIAITQATQWMQDNLLDVLGCRFDHRTNITLEGSYLKDPRASEIGCEPDFDAYTENGKQRDRLSADILGDKRYGGGHIHVQYNNEVLPAFAAAKFLDLFIVLPFLYADKQGPRRQIYGLPGLFRPKPYGLEHRTLSNFWVFQNGVRSRLAQNVLAFANNSFNNEYLQTLSDCYPVFPWEDVRTAVRNHDLKTAKVLMDLANSRYNLGIPCLE